MSLRFKILALYVFLALITMVVGAGNYAQSLHSLGTLVQAKLEAASQNAASAILNRYGTLQSSLLRPLTPATPGASGSGEPVPGAESWRVLGSDFARVEYRSGTGHSIPLFVATNPPEVDSHPCEPGADSLVEIHVRLREGRSGGGEIVGWVPARSLLPEQTLNVRFGHGGQTVVLDRQRRAVLYDARCRAEAGTPDASPSGPMVLDWKTLDSEHGLLPVFDGGDQRTGGFASLSVLPWTVVSAADIDEFTSPYARMQLLNLLMMFAVVALVGGAFLLLARYYMSSLEDLALAADRIGEGELMPWLPPPGQDEVGKLSEALAVMLARLKTTIRQNEIARQMSVVGEVAAQLSHEIRNPLSSIRLNLQSVERETRRGEVPADLEQVLHLCLREISRLDDAVKSVLEAGRPKPISRRPCQMEDVLDDSLDLMRPRLEKSGIRIQHQNGLRAPILGDEEQLRGVFVNLFLNAADVMPDGGTLRVWTERSEEGEAGEVRVHVVDSGPGIRPDVRDSIFQPFFTTKPSGSGIGLPTALQVVKAHGGRLYLERRSEMDVGAEFVVALPLAAAPETGNPGAGDDTASGAGGSPGSSAPGPVAPRA